MAIAICSSTESIPSKSGNKSPFLYPLVTITPYFLGSKSSLEEIDSGGLRTSTFIVSNGSSSSVIDEKRGSSVEALIALLIISSAIEFVVGKKVPIHPLKAPNLWIDTKTPALLFNNSLDISFGTSIFLFSLIYVSIVFLARLTY